MKKTFAISLIMLVIAGCSTPWTYGLQMLREARGGLALLVGLPEAEVFNVLGYPDGKQEFGEDTVYVWGNNQTIVEYINTAPYGATKTVQAIPTNSNCTIKVIVSGGLAKGSDFKGDWGACPPYLGRLIHYFKQKNP